MVKVASRSHRGRIATRFGPGPGRVRDRCRCKSGARVSEARVRGNRIKGYVQVTRIYCLSALDKGKVM
jgi:hypothetical protein